MIVFLTFPVVSILENVMKTIARRKKSGVSAVFTAVSLLSLLSFSPAASAMVFFDIDGNYITIFGYTFCFSDCDYKSGAVEFPRKAAVPNPLPK